MNRNQTITRVPDVLVGHSQDFKALTGCTVLLFPKGASAGIDQRGGAPGTRETDLLRPMHLIQKIHAIVLSGGSAFGLDSASGAVRYLEERKIGVDVGVAKVPIVPAAILFDLSIGSSTVRPNAEMGYKACLNASSSPVELGNVGVGTGATIGKIIGNKSAMKAGIGSAVVQIGNGIYVGAIIALNAFGDVYDPSNGQIIAGARQPGKTNIQADTKIKFIDTLSLLKRKFGQLVIQFATSQNTIIGCVATNAELTNEGCNKVAQMAHNGIAMTVRPAHTMLDGDTLFAVSTGGKKADVSTIGAYAAEVVAQSILSAVSTAQGVAGIPALQDFDHRL